MNKYCINFFSGTLELVSANTPLGLQLNEKDMAVGFVALAPDFESAETKLDAWEKKWSVWVHNYNQWVCGGKKNKFAALRART